MLWICLQCTTAYSVGAQGCPHCGSSEYAEEGTEMAKITRHGGPTHKAGQLPDLPTAEEAAVTFTTGPATVELVLPEAVGDEERESPGTGVVMVEDEGPDDAPDGPYAVMLRGDLQTLCAGRGLPTSGTKAELIARLTASDEAEQDSDPA